MKTKVTYGKPTKKQVEKFERTVKEMVEGRKVSDHRTNDPLTNQLVESNAREVSKATAPPEQAARHGYDCVKVRHETKRSGYLHDDLDDGPYDVDGVLYCGRCHIALPKNSLARKGPSPELGNADERGHPSPARPGERSTGQKPDRSSPESLPPQAASDVALDVQERFTRALVSNNTLEQLLLCNWTKDAAHNPVHGLNINGLINSLVNLLGAALASHDQKVQREVLEEAFNLRPYLANEGNSAQFREGYYAGLEAFRQAIKRAYDERPATEKKCS